MGVRQHRDPRPADPELAVGTPAAVVFPSYSLSPEARYPTAIEQIYAVARWIAAQGSANGFDSSWIAIAGDSVGGNMATAVSLLAKACGGPTFAHQLLFYPVTDVAFDTPSYEQFAELFHLRRDAMQWFWDQYTTDPAQRAEITVAPASNVRRPRRAAAGHRDHCGGRRAPRRR